ncbi:MAG: M48 family metalloprotease [Spirochaetes bacterium]|nr:M48 family metalloprotease [Spirochaetota bacterium]
MPGKIILIVSVYLLLLITLSVFGFAGDRSKETADLALKYFTESEIETGAALFRHRLFFSILYAVPSVLLLSYLSAGAWRKFRQKYLGRIRSEYAAFFLSLIIVYLGLILFRFPFSLYSGFFTGKKYGLINIDIVTWSLRFFSSSIIFILLFSFLVLLFALFIKKTRKYIFYIPVVFFLFGIIYAYISPRYITPLFYETEILKDNLLKAGIENLYKKTGLQISEIYVLKTSAVHNSANAYMIGTGPAKRVVLYDTLLGKFTDDEILSIVAHETGHYEEEHVTIGLMIGAFGIMLVFFLLKKTARSLTGKDMEKLFHADMVPVLLLLIIIFSFAARPVGNTISRYMENRADMYSLKLAGNSDAFINLSVRLKKINKGNIIPNKIYSAFYSTHPPVLERIKTAEEYR